MKLSEKLNACDSFPGGEIPSELVREAEELEARLEAAEGHLEEWKRLAQEHKAKLAEIDAVKAELEARVEALEAELKNVAEDLAGAGHRANLEIAARLAAERKLAAIKAVKADTVQELAQKILNVIDGEGEKQVKYMVRKGDGSEMVMDPIYYSAKYAKQKAREDLRNQAAIAAMQGLLAYVVDADYAEIARDAAQIADALLAELEKVKP